jgi:ssDNA-binding Zn-finger/Zn-ribbon topoisomerase 1
MPLTKEAKRKYLNDQGVHCPFCGSHNIDARKMDFLDEMIYQKVECIDCQNEWTDHYKLVGISEPEGEGGKA